MRVRLVAASALKPILYKFVEKSRLEEDSYSLWGDHMCCHSSGEWCIAKIAVQKKIPVPGLREGVIPIKAANTVQKQGQSRLTTILATNVVSRRIFYKHRQNLYTHALNSVRQIFSTTILEV